jgi:hypothetical protein
MSNFFIQTHDVEIPEQLNENHRSFFHHCNDVVPSRDFRQGVSFRCRPFDLGTTYHNDDFVQDFVI